VPYTSHGWWIGRGTQPTRVPRLDCGGPHRCPSCALDAHHAHQDTRRLPVPVMLGLEPEPRRLIAALRIVADRARRCREELAAIPEDSAPIEYALEALGIVERHSAGCADELEALTADQVAQHRADDDGMPPSE
jgi:hypothetical protein